VHISIVVPTRNRAAFVDRLLSTLAREVGDCPAVDIVVVDNGSRDATKSVVQEWIAAGAPARYVVEPVAGVSRARNAGIAVARGDVVAFLDDDVLPRPGWLEAVRCGFARRTSVGIVCGPAELVLDGPRPRWFGPEVTSWFSACDFGPEPRALDDPTEVPWALNLAVRTDLAREVGGFPVHLGRVDTSLRSGEEAPFVARIRGSGGIVAYEPAAAVLHHVPAERLRVRWLLRRAWAEGRSSSGTARAMKRPEAALHTTRELAVACLRGWRAAARRMRHVDDPREALVADLCWRITRLASAWSPLRSHRG
jgi:glycosyltransferase involved in cell wall biosynthesis